MAERRRADLQTATTRAVVDFLRTTSSKSPTPPPEPAWRRRAYPRHRKKVRDALDRAAASIGDRFQNQPEVEAEIRNTIGSTYFNLNIVSMAKSQLESAYALRKQHLGPLHPDSLESLRRHRHGAPRRRQVRGSGRSS